MNKIPNKLDSSLKFYVDTLGWDFGCLCEEYPKCRNCAYFAEQLYAQIMGWA